MDERDGMENKQLIDRNHEKLGRKNRRDIRLRLRITLWKEEEYFRVPYKRRKDYCSRSCIQLNTCGDSEQINVNKKKVEKEQKKHERVSVWTNHFRISWMWDKRMGACQKNNKSRQRVNTREAERKTKSAPHLLICTQDEKRVQISPVYNAPMWQVKNQRQQGITKKKSDKWLRRQNAYEDKSHGAKQSDNKYDNRNKFGRHTIQPRVSFSRFDLYGHKDSRQNHRFSLSNYAESAKKQRF